MPAQHLRTSVRNAPFTVQVLDHTMRPLLAAGSHARLARVEISARDLLAALFGFFHSLGVVDRYAPPVPSSATSLCASSDWQVRPAGFNVVMLSAASIALTTASSIACTAAR